MFSPYLIPIIDLRSKADVNDNQAIGACGHQHTDNDWVLALSPHLFDPHTPGGNPNSNALCGRSINVQYNEKTDTLVVADRCEACAGDDLDLSPAAFQGLAPLDVGRIQGTWGWA
jgi:hypothetical protein